MEGYTVYFYEKALLGTNIITFMQNIHECDLILVIGTPKYKEKSMKIKTGGVFFEENVLGDVYINGKYDSIIPIAFGDFTESFPPPFNGGKGMRCKRIDTNFLDTLVAEINKKFGGK
jgi:hypothetical protein